NRVNRFNHCVRVGIGIAAGLQIYGEYYFRDFLNTDFTTDIDGVEVQPYNGLEISRFNIGLSVIRLND
ncbi:MAG: hypothetical protein AAF789_13790, partial [Bacteroidota bacterium]